MPRELASMYPRRSKYPLVRTKIGSEESLAFQLAQFLQYQYPNIIYHFDYGSGVKLTMGQAIKQKKLNRRAYPDLFIAEPRNDKHGLFLELKKDGTTIYKQNGELVASPHIREQFRVLSDLQNRGYVANFAIGYDNAVIQIRKYLDIKTSNDTVVDTAF